MTSVTERLTVVEVQAAARALLAGVYRPASWSLRAGDTPALVVGCQGGAGATTVALALATAAGPSRLIECCTAGESGLVAAGYSELGEQGPGWLVSERDGVRLERRAPTEDDRPDASAPLPGAGDSLTVVIDAGHDLPALRGGWLRPVWDAAPVVLVTRGSVPGLRRVEATLADLEPTVGRVVAVVIGPPRKRWPKDLTYTLGRRTRDLDDDGALLAVAEDRTLASRGLDAMPLPADLLAAAQHLASVLGLPGVPS